MNYMLAPLIPRGQLRNRVLSKDGLAKRAEADRIIDIIVEFYNIPINALKGKSKKRVHVFPRHLCMWVFVIQNKITLRDAGIMLGRRNHTTTMHGVKTINDLMFSSVEIRDEIEEVLNKIKKQ